MKTKEELAREIDAFPVYEETNFWKLYKLAKELAWRVIDNDTEEYYRRGLAEIVKYTDCGSTKVVAQNYLDKVGLKATEADNENINA